jgi:hypothetical protein
VLSDDGFNPNAAGAAMIAGQFVARGSEVAQ